MRLVFGRIEKGEKPPAQKFKWRQLKAKFRRQKNFYELYFDRLKFFKHSVLLGLAL